MAPLAPYIISGGKNTERFYFQHISRNTDWHFNIYPQYFGGESNYITDFPKRIAQIQKNNADARIYCVFDWDTIHDDKTCIKKHEDFEKSIKSEIDSGSVVLCPSMPCFEYWFLLHFQNYRTLLRTCEDVCKVLEPYMLPYFTNKKTRLIDIIKDRKNLEKDGWVKSLCADGKLKQAIERAEKNINKATSEGEFENQSYSYVYKLFKK